MLINIDYEHEYEKDFRDWSFLNGEIVTQKKDQFKSTADQRAQFEVVFYVHVII